MSNVWDHEGIHAAPFITHKTLHFQMTHGSDAVCTFTHSKNNGKNVGDLAFNRSCFNVVFYAPIHFKSFKLNI